MTRQVDATSRRGELRETQTSPVSQGLVTTIREANVPIGATNLWRAWKAKLVPPTFLRARDLAAAVTFQTE